MNKIPYINVVEATTHIDSCHGEPNIVKCVYENNVANSIKHAITSAKRRQPVFTKTQVARKLIQPQMTISCVISQFTIFNIYAYHLYVNICVSNSLLFVYR